MWLRHLKWLTTCCVAAGFCVSVSRGQTTIPLLDINTNVWRFNDKGSDLGTAWRATFYPDESTWTNGVGLFGVETTVPYPYLPYPVRTPLVLGAGRMTYYFRTHFPLDYNPASVLVQGTAYVDDGAIFYLNGNEVGRVRLTNNPVFYTNSAQLASPEGVAFILNIPSANLVLGDNVLAVEVHQHSASDADVIFGLGLQATATAAPFIRNPAEPADRAIPQFGSTVLTVDGVGNPTPAYQWYHNGILVPGATGPSLALENVGDTDHGGYFVILTNASGTATSRVAQVNVILDTVAPRIVYAVALPDLPDFRGQFYIQFSETMEPFPTGASDTFNWEVYQMDGKSLFVSEALLVDGTNLTVITSETPDHTQPFYAVFNGSSSPLADLAGNPVAMPPIRIPIASFSNEVVALDASHPWYFEQSGADLGTAWRSNSFNDTNWTSGPGTFDIFRSFVGNLPNCRDPIPDTNERLGTCLSLSNANNTAQLSTTYFRTHFTFYGDAQHSVLLLKTLVDDGAIFYLNGTEITRIGMPFTPVINATLANRTVANAVFEYMTNSGAALLQGDNVLAVEVHQDGLTTPDITFGAKLSVITPDIGLGAVAAGGNINLLWMPGMGRLQSATNVNGPWTDQVPSMPPNQHSEPLVGLQKYFRIVAP